MGQYIETDFFELLVLNLNGQELLAEERAQNFSQDVLAGYALGLYKDNADMTAYVEKSLDQNFYVAERLTRIRHYINYYDIETMADFLARTEADTLEDALAEEAANALSNEEIEQQVTEFFENDPDFEPAAFTGWVFGGPTGLA